MKTYLKILCLGLAVLAFSADANPKGPQNNGSNHPQTGSGVTPRHGNNEVYDFYEFIEHQNYGREVSSRHRNLNARIHSQLNSPDEPSFNQVPLPGTLLLMAPCFLVLILISRKFRQRPNI